MKTKKIRKLLQSLVLLIIAITIVLCTTCDLLMGRYKQEWQPLNLDTRQAPKIADVYHDLAKKVPSLPVEDLLKSHRHVNNSCAPYPSLQNIHIYHDLWQVYQNRNISYYIFGAYYDNRPRVVHNQHVVRVLTMMTTISRTKSEYPLTYCQLWFKEQTQSVIVPVNDLRPIWYYEWKHSQDYNYPHLLDCVVPMSHKQWIPTTISLAATPCQKATNNVRVIYNNLKEQEQRQDFAVCMKGINFPYADLSHRFIEFIEIQRILGASKIVMYDLVVHPNISKVLRYYEQSKLVEFRPFSLTSKSGNLPEYRHLSRLTNRLSHRIHEVIAYNDCLYRNMYRYEYVAIIDMDEILMPLNPYERWLDLMKYAQTIRSRKCKGYASFCFRCTYFPPNSVGSKLTLELPSYFHMLQHVQRVRQHVKPDFATKCFHSCDSVITSHNHYPRHWAEGMCASYVFDSSVAHMHHYRVPEYKANLSDTVLDMGLWRFKDEIMRKSLEVLYELGFL